MTDTTVSRGATVKIGKVDGSLFLGQDARVQAESTSPIQVSGDVVCEGDAHFEGSLNCGRFQTRDGNVGVTGDLTCETEVRAKRGELEVNGNLVARSVEVDDRLTIRKSGKADNFDVGGALEVGETITARNVDVGGSFQVRGTAEVEDIDVGGRLDVAGQVKISRLDAGGSARVGGGEVTRIDVGGSFSSTAPLKFGDIDVGGTVSLEKGGVGGGIDVGGRFESRGNLSFERIDVGGTVEITGNGEGDSVDIGGHLEVSGDLILKRDLDIGGKARVGGNLKLQSLDVGGLIEARQIEAQDKVEDVYAESATLEEGVRARNLYLHEGRIESRCRIAGEVLYKDNLETDSDVEFAKSPVKTDRLPKPPI